MSRKIVECYAPSMAKEFVYLSTCLSDISIRADEAKGCVRIDGYDQDERSKVWVEYYLEEYGVRIIDYSWDDRTCDKVTGRKPTFDQFVKAFNK